MNDETRAETFADQKKKNRKENLEVFIYALIGLAISVGSFLLFHYFGKFRFVTGLICLCDTIYTYFHVCIFFRSKDWRWAKRIFIPWLMVIYWALVLVVICIFSAALLNSEFTYKFLLYPIFLMPSFILEIILIGFIGSGI